LWRGNGLEDTYYVFKEAAYTWPFTRSSSGVGGERLACRSRVSGTDDLDDKTSVLSKLRSSSRSPRTTNDPYTPSPCCETNGPFYFFFFLELPRPVRYDFTRFVPRLTSPRLGSAGTKTRLRQLHLSFRVENVESCRDPLNRGSAKGAHNWYFSSLIKKIFATRISD